MDSSQPPSTSFECSFSALDGYFSQARAPVRFMAHEGDLVSLASGRERLSFPGLPYADAGDDSDDAQRLRFRCLDGDLKPAYPQLKLTKLPQARRFNGRGGVYERLGDARPEPEGGSAELVLFEAAVLAARYDYEPRLDGAEAGEKPDALYQRDLLDLIISAKRPEKGLELLLKAGFLEQCWPELHQLCSVAHAKEYHPEGDAWRHTLETFSHRKGVDHVLSLALLLHDTGKPDAVENEGRRFDGHSELGEQTARAFLRRLGYPRAIIDDVAFLVRYHMMPGALTRIPPSSVEHILRHPLFPTLLELYRCDELSTFRGPEGYYAACSAYKAYLKNTKNPYRGADGKKRAQGRTE
jgi:poly(A) polymerase